LAPVRFELVTRIIVQGGKSFTARTCGKPACPCHADPTRRHVPSLHFSWRSNGKASALNVPPEYVQEARQAGLSDFIA
jgi:hypothetical protein